MMPLLERAKPHATGLFELKFLNMYWYQDDEDAFKTLTKNLDATVSARSQKQPRSVAPMPPDEVAQLLNDAYGSGWIARISSDPSSETVQAEKHRLEGIAQQECWRSALRWTAYWASFLVALAALVHSIHLFFFRLYCSHAAKRSCPLLVPVGIQVFIAVLGIGSFAVIPFGWPGIVLLPAIATILFAETWAWFRKGRIVPQSP
jgi:hypothetical protein